MGWRNPHSMLSDFDLIRYSDWLNLKDAPGKRLLKGLIPPFSLSLVHKSLQEVRSFQPDVVLTFYALPCGLAAAWIQRRMRIPVLLSIIGRDVPGPAIPRFWGTYVRWSMRSVERTLFISDYCRQALSESEKSADDVIPFGVDTVSYTPDLDASPLRIKLGIPQEAKILLAIQRLDPWKQVDVLIRAQSIVLKKTDAYLVVGGKGPELKRLQSLAHDLGISSRVLFTGYIADRELPLYYAVADLFVFHSSYETFCLSLAAGHGCRETDRQRSLHRHPRTDPPWRKWAFGRSWRCRRFCSVGLGAAGRRGYAEAFFCGVKTAGAGIL